MSCDVKKKVEEIIQFIVGQSEYDLIEIKIRSQQKGLIFEVVTDKPQGGISLDQCIRLNQEIRREFENVGLEDDELYLEVNSPGLDRPLIREKDFVRVLGREIRVHLKEKVSEKMEFRGIVQSVDIQNLELKIKKNSKKKKNVDEKKRVIIPLDKIQMAIQII